MTTLCIGHIHFEMLDNIMASVFLVLFFTAVLGYEEIL